jgi:hypothetical protein
MKIKNPTISNENVPTFAYNHGGHSHFIRAKGADPNVSIKYAQEWCKKVGYQTFGIGSPWTSLSSKHYLEAETVNRNEYYSEKTNPEEHLDKEEIFKLIEDLNKQDDTYFFLDNETPKNRFGHLWYIGFTYKVPAWHDYSQDKPVSFTPLDEIKDPNPLHKDGVQLRRSYAQVIAEQQNAGALAIWAHPTSWWFYKDYFTTNIAAELMPCLVSNGHIDGITVVGYDAYHVDYQALWFALLDRKWRVPGYAEMDGGFANMPPEKNVFKNAVPLKNNEKPKFDDMKEEMRLGHHYMTSGPELILSVDGNPMGTTISSDEKKTFHATLIAKPSKEEAKLSRVQLVTLNNTVIYETRDFTGGTIEFDIELPTDLDYTYIVARCFGENDDPETMRQQQIKHCALTNPIFFATKNVEWHKPLISTITLSVSEDSKYCGQEYVIDDLHGNTSERKVLEAGEHIIKTSPQSLLKLYDKNNSETSIPLSMANKPLREYLEGIAAGKFLEQFPNCEPGQVPVAVFRLDDIEGILKEFTVSL